MTTMDATSPAARWPALPATRKVQGALAAGLVLALVATMAILWPAVTGPFVFDDFPNLQNLRQLGDTPDAASLRRYVAAFSGNPGRPLSGLSFAIEDSAWPSDPLPYKRNNILLHLLAGVLVFVLVRQLARLHAGISARAEAVALVVMTLWLLHPMHLSALMLVVQRMTLLSSIFMLAGLAAYVACVGRTGGHPAGRVVMAGGSLAVFGTLALGCKENGVLIFAFATALNLSLLRPAVARLPGAWRQILLWGAAAPILLLAALAAWRLPEIAASYGVRDFTLTERLLTQPRVLLDYLQQILLPRPGGQGLFHDDYLVSHSLLDPPWTLIAVMVVAGLTAAAIVLRARAPIFSFAVLWFLAGHLIESTVIPLELYFDHRNYLAMLGPLLALVALVLRAQPRYRTMAWAALAVWLALATAQTALGARIWGDRDTLAAVWLEENPDSVRAIQFMAASQFDRRQFDDAKQTLLTGLQARPEAQELSFQHALAQCLTTGIPQAQLHALQASASTIAFARVIPDVVAALGDEARENQCNGSFSTQAFQKLVEKLLRNPHFARDAATQGFMHYELGRLAHAQLDLDRTMYHLDQTYRYRPNPAVPREQAIYLLSAGLPADALRYLDLSDNTPRPALTRWLEDMPTLNAPLRRAAERMQHAQEGAAVAVKADDAPSSKPATEPSEVPDGQ